MEYYHQIITEKSFKLLQDIRRKYKFILIGGWAVFLYSKVLKSKDIDIIVEYEELEKLRQKFTLNKNERLRKYEITIDEIDIDIYVPFYSDLGISVEEIKKYLKNIEGFYAPRPEILLILKQKAYFERQGTYKGQKDKIDIFSLLKNTEFDLEFYERILKEHNFRNYIEELKNLVQMTNEVPEIALNQFQYSKFKKRVLEQLI